MATQSNSRNIAVKRKQQSHRRVNIGRGIVGGTAGAVLGGMLAGPVGVMVGGALGTVVAKAIDEEKTVQRDDHLDDSARRFARDAGMDAKVRMERSTTSSQKRPLGVKALRETRVRADRKTSKGTARAAH